MIPDDDFRAHCPNEMQAYMMTDGRVLSSIICKMLRITLRPGNNLKVNKIIKVRSFSF